MSNRRNFLKTASISLTAITIFPEILKGGNIRARTFLQKAKSPFFSLEPAMAPYPLKKIISVEEENYLKIFAIDYTLPATLPSHINRLQVVCFNLSLESDCKYQAKDMNVEIYANYIDFNKHSINISGEDGASIVKALDGQKWGDEGKSGVDKLAKSGNNGGSLTIYCSETMNDGALIAKGGTGGTGQGGGTGYQGAPGPDGIESSNDDETNGHTGGQGGHAGNGGRGGRAGNGGSIKVYYLDTAFLGTETTLDITAGNPGSGGDPGGVGIGGTGGHPGRHKDPPRDQTLTGHNGGGHGGRSKESIPASILSSSILHISQMNACCKPGGPGSAGEKGKPGPLGEKGAVGKLEIKKISANEFGKAMLVYPQFLSLLSVELDRSFIEGNYEQVKRIVSFFLKNIINNVSDVNYTAKYACARVIGINNSILMGYDFWGNVNNFSPNINVKPLIPIVHSILSDFIEIEKAYIAYSRINADIEAKKINAQLILDNARLSLERKNSELEELKVLAYSLSDEIFSLAQNLAVQQNELSFSQESFKLAVTRASGCSIGDTFGFISKIAVVAASGGSAFAAFAASATVIPQVFAHHVETDAVKNIVKKIDIIGGSISTSINAFNTAKEQFNKLSTSEANLDILAMSQGDIDALKKQFNAMIEKNSDLVEAKKFKNDFYSYINQISVLQQKRMQYTDVNNRGAALEVEIIKFKNVLGDENVLLSEIQISQDSATVQAAMWNLYYEARLRALYVLYIEKKAYNYWSLSDESPNSVASSDASFLLAYHNDIQVKIVNHNILESRGPQKVSRLDVGDKSQTFLIDKTNYPIAFSQFLIPDSDHNYTLLITIPIASKPFDIKWREVYARSIRVYFKNAKTNNQLLSVKIVHMGNSTFVDRNGKILNFTHSPVSITLTCQLTKNIFVREEINNNIIGASNASSESFLGVSPFATWKIIIDSESNPGLDLSSLISVRIGFDIFYVPAS